VVVRIALVVVVAVGVNAAMDAVCQRAARQQDTGGDMADLGGLDPNDPEGQPTVQQLLNDLERIRAISGLNACWSNEYDLIFSEIWR
jgi:hypothetical protein